MESLNALDAARRLSDVGPGYHHVHHHPPAHGGHSPRGLPPGYRGQRPPRPFPPSSYHPRPGPGWPPHQVMIMNKMMMMITFLLTSEAHPGPGLRTSVPEALREATPEVASPRPAEAGPRGLSPVLPRDDVRTQHCA